MAQALRAEPDTISGSARPRGGRRAGSVTVSQQRAAAGMALPFLVLFAVFFAGPLIYSIVYSFRAGGTGAFAGLLNYRTVASNAQYWGGVERMIVFGLVQVTIMIGLAVVLALYLDSTYCVGRKFFALVYFLPYAVPGVIAAIMWAFLLEPDLDSALNVPHLLHLTSAPVAPLSYGLFFYGLMLIVTWEFTGYNMTILLTSLTSVNRQLLDAAAIDGASELRIAWRIKFPLIRRTVMFTVILSIIGTLQLFNEPVIINDIAVTSNSYTPNQVIYNTAFSFGNEPLAAAQSVLLAAITIVATVMFYSIVRRRADVLGRRAR